MSGLIEGASSGSTQVHKSDPYKRNTLPWSHLTSGLIKGASSGSSQVHKSDPYKNTRPTMEPSYVILDCEGLSYTDHKYQHYSKVSVVALTVMTCSANRCSIQKAVLIRWETHYPSLYS